MLSFTSRLSSECNAFAIFVTEKYSYKDPKNILPNNIVQKINSYLGVLKAKKKEEEISFFDISNQQKCFIIKVKSKHESYYPEEIGGTLFSCIKQFKEIKKVELYADSLTLDSEKISKFFSEFILGFSLKSYTFNKYKTLGKDKINNKIDFQIITTHKNRIEFNYKYCNAIREGVFLTRDLVSEPPNVLSPQAYVSEIKKLSKFGLKIKSYGEKELKKMGLNALLGVGQGSSNETFLVTIEWNGKKQNKIKPLAFVGKGVCFDTGGISLKPARFMEEMKYDMAGSAVVVGLLKTLALRKAKINAVGVVGLVENMPGGNAQRPGDIVKSYSGKTIEILNTDAEGRLVLADALSFTEKKYKPKFIIDLATLT